MKAFRPGVIYSTIKMHYQTYSASRFLDYFEGSAIVILKRNDLPQEQRHRAVGSLELEHVKLSPELIEYAELIVFVESAAIKLLKHFRDIQSKHSVEILMEYIRSTAPVPQACIPWRRSQQGVRRKGYEHCSQKTAYRSSPTYHI
jgi:hypothetical protein